MAFLASDRNAVLADISKNLDEQIERGKAIKAKLDELIEKNRQEIERLTDQEQFEETARRA